LGKRLNTKFSTDTLYFKKRSLTGNIGCQIFSHKSGFNVVYHIPKSNDEYIGNALKDFISDYGAPDRLTMDGAAVQVGRHTTFQKLLRDHGITKHISAPYSPNQNPAEGAIREVKKRWYRMQSKLGIPDRLTDFGIQYVCETGNVTANSSRYVRGRTPIELITGDTPDISEYFDFGFFDFVQYRSNGGLDTPRLGRWLGVSHRVGKLMSYWILPKSGIPISATTVQRVTNLEKQTDVMKDRMNDFQKSVQNRWEARSSAVELPPDDQRNILSLENEDEDFINEFNRVITSADLPISHDEKIGADNFINMEVGINMEEQGFRHGRVKRRAIDADGKPIGRANNNVLLDDRAYEMEFEDGTTEILTANIIAENLLAQVDPEGNRFLFMEEIEDHRKLADAIPIGKGTLETARGIKRKKRTTRGWEFLVKWKGGSSDWVALRDLKESYPVQLADYAVSNDLQDEPAFAWWLPYVNRKRKTIISKVKSKYFQRTHKYGLRIPKTWKEALQIDRENGDHLWEDAIKQEMKNSRIAFQAYDGEIKDLIGYEQITCHLIFDIKLSECFRRKARFVADGHKVSTPPSMSYSTVVSRDSVRILLLAAALNDLDILGCDVQNAFLSADNLEKHYLIAGDEFGHEKGKVFIVVRALYGLKSASAAFRSFMAKRLDEMNFVSSTADPDVWLRPAIKPDGTEYYEYVLCYVDDILAISIDPKSVLEGLKGGTVKFKNDKIETPEMYLGAKLQKKSIDGMECWTITSEEYIKAAVNTIKTSISKGGRWTMPKGAKTPMNITFVPELDASAELPLKI